MTTVIIDYGSGNLHSAAKAFERAARESETGAPILVSGRPEDLRRASRIVLPGVGAFADCLHGLSRTAGMIEALEEAVLQDAKPFLGICVGMQLLAGEGHEDGIHKGLDWIAGKVVAIDPGADRLKVPHMGWNDLALTGRGHDHPLLSGIESGRHGYFVHGYRFCCAEPGDILAEVDYGGPVAAVVGRDTIAGVQFHPEKSQSLGLRLIANFLRWAP